MQQNAVENRLSPQCGHVGLVLEMLRPVMLHAETAHALNAARAHVKSCGRHGALEESTILLVPVAADGLPGRAVNAAGWRQSVGQKHSQPLRVCDMWRGRGAWWRWTHGSVGFESTVLTRAHRLGLFVGLHERRNSLLILGLFNGVYGSWGSATAGGEALAQGHDPSWISWSGL